MKPFNQIEFAAEHKWNELIYSFPWVVSDTITPASGSLWEANVVAAMQKVLAEDYTVQLYYLGFLLYICQDKHRGDFLKWDRKQIPT